MIVIKKALAKVAQATTLLDLLHKRLSAFEEARSHHQIHISDMSEGFCAREYALLDLTKKKPKGQFVNTPMRVAFDNGMALHDLCRNKWLKDDVVGAWHCRVCHHVVHFCKRPVEACSKCHKKLWEYKEEEFRDPENPLITGSIDFFVDFGLGKHRMVEVKSISKDEFAELKAPLGEHRIRTVLYLELMRRSARPEKARIDLEKGHVLYISKGYGKKTDEAGKITPFREFVVEADAKAAKPYFDSAMAVKIFRDSGKMPSGFCKTAMDRRVASCGVAKECWSGMFPVGV